MPVGAVLQGVSTAANIIKGGIDYFSANAQEKKDKNELAGLTPAFYKVQDEYYRNNNAAAELAQGGFTQDAKDYYGDMAGRGLGTGISGVLQAGGSPNDIAKIFDGYNSSIRSMATADSQTQMDNIRYYGQTNKDLAAQKTIQWGVNEYQPYQNKLKELTERIAADKINKNNAINSVIGSVSSAGVAASNQDLISKLFSGKSGETEDPFRAETVQNAAKDFNFFNASQGEDLGENYNRPSALSENKPVWKSGEVMSEDQISQILEMISQSSRQKE